MNNKRLRAVGSVKLELLKKSIEAALAAVQIFNSPSIQFKSESYIVLMNIAWTYLLHAYFRSMKIEYRYYKQKFQRKTFDTTSHGAYKYWSLETCLNHQGSPVDRNSTNNLRFLIGLRNEIEHQMTSRIDDLLSARFQACCLNYNHYLKKLFGNKHGLEKHLSFSIQLSSIKEEQKNLLVEQKGLPANIMSFIQKFDESLSPTEFDSPNFAYRVWLVQKTVNSKGQADHVIEFVKEDSPLAKNLNKEYAVIKHAEKRKYLPGQIVEIFRKEGYTRFSMHHHTNLMKKYDAKNPTKGYGVLVADKQWLYYDTWIDVIRKHCRESGDKYLP